MTMQQTPMPQRSDKEIARRQEAERQAAPTSTRAMVAPAVDIYENDNEIMIVADMPGVKRDELDVRFADDTLSLRAERRLDAQGTPLLREMHTTAYFRNFLVPKGIDVTNISANLKDGVLQVHLPKSEEYKPRQIEVKGG